MAPRKDENADRPDEAARRMAGQGVAQIAEFGRRSTDQMRSFATAGARVYRDITEVSRPEVDALMQSGAKLAKGVQDMGWEWMQYTQNSLRLGMRTANDLMGCRSVEDMMQVGSDYLRESVDTFLHESAKMLEMSSSVANDAATPISERQH